MHGRKSNFTFGFTSSGEHAALFFPSQNNSRISICACVRASVWLFKLMNFVGFFLIKFKIPGFLQDDDKTKT